ncbi:MAG: hypothetical protein PWQ55_485 [Chloroflexota bacterium]|nr:hypothetical protein [Chloroflexota bacterium]
MSKYLDARLAQCRRPSGLFGLFIIRGMNKHHAELTKWGMEAVDIHQNDVILDVGCGGGVTVRRLARLAPQGKVYGIDYAKRSVASSKRTNRARIRRGQVDIRLGSVSELPYEDNTFDLVTAFETYFFWPDLPADLREVQRVLKPGGHLLIGAATYKGSRFDERNAKWIEAGNMTNLSVEEFEDLFKETDYRNVRVEPDIERGWIRCIGEKPD